MRAQHRAQLGTTLSECRKLQAVLVVAAYSLTHCHLTRTATAASILEAGDASVH